MNNRFTDINVPYSVDPDDKRTDEEVLADMEKNLGVKVIRLTEKPSFLKNKSNNC